MELKEKLSRLRRKQGWTQDELALKLSVTRQAVSKWERGVVAPTAEKLIALSRLYGVPLDELVNGEPQCGEPPATAEAVVEEPETASLPKPNKPKIAGAVVLAACILLTAIVSVVTLYYITSTGPEEPKDGLLITWQDDLEWENIDLEELAPFDGEVQDMNQ